MTDPQLPPELAEIEVSLRHDRAAAGPLVAGRVLGAVGMALADQRRVDRRRNLLAVAAALLVVLHASWWGGDVSLVSRPGRIEQDQVAAGARAMRAIVPELSMVEAERQARLALFYAQSSPAPQDAPFALPRPFGMGQGLD